ncbi:colicin E3-like toxin immunity protein [Pseudomonas sp. ZT5P21]
MQSAQPAQPLLAAMVAVFWKPSLGDSALYGEGQPCSLRLANSWTHRRKIEGSKNIYEDVMGLKISLEWYDKRTEMGEGEELSKDFGDDGSVVEALGMPIENNVNNGGFNVSPDWVSILQPHFHHTIQLLSCDYQVAFIYRDKWQSK